MELAAVSKISRSDRAEEVAILPLTAEVLLAKQIVQ